MTFGTRVPTIKQGRRPEDPRMNGANPGDSPVVPDRVVVPPPPMYDDSEPQLRDEQQVARVEVLMTKGVRGRAQLMALLNVPDARTMDRYMKRVFARWEMLGTSRDLARHRGEALNRLDLIESQLWSDASNSGDARVSVAAMKVVSDVNRQRMELLGLTAKAVEQLTAGTGESAMAFSKRLATHTAQAVLARRMMEMVDEATAAMDRELDRQDAAEQAEDERVRGTPQDLVIEGETAQADEGSPAEGDTRADR